MLKFKITQENGIVWSEGRDAQSLLYTLQPGNYILLAIPEPLKRTIDQNALIWAFYNDVAKFLTAQGAIRDIETNNLVECTAEMVHEHSKNVPELKSLLPKRFRLTFDKTTIELSKPTTTKLDKKRFSEYYEAVVAYWHQEIPNLHYYLNFKQNNHE